jgi:hypothetical protein
MAKRLISVLAAVGLVAGALIASPATVQAAPEVPAEPNIVDPPGDANYINNNQTQGQSGNNHTTPADASSLGDILAVWFTHDAEKISVHVQTEAPQPSSGAAYIVFFFANPDECLYAEFAIAAPSYQGDSYAEVEDSCAGLEPAEGEVVSEEGPDGTGIITAAFPRSYSASFGDGAVIGTPRIEMRHLNGGPASLRGPTIDNTDPGSDYTIAGGADTEAPPKEAKEEPKKKKKKGKKKGNGKSAACAPFAPGEAGADQPSVTLTDAATEEAPVEQVVTLDMSLADLQVGDPSSAFFNIQVDSAAPDAGLYVLLEFPTRRDYDLNLLHPDASYAARSHAWNTVIEANESQISSTGHGGESTASSEKLVGIKTADCSGWTLEAQNWLGEGGDLPVKLWLGEVQNEPQAEGEEPP